MNMAEALQAVEAETTVRGRTKVIQELLSKDPNWKTPAGRTEMQQRGLLMTALRKRGIWP